MGLFVSSRFFEDHPAGLFSSNRASLLFNRRCHGRTHDFWGLLTARTVDCALWVFDYCCRYRHRALGRFNDLSIGIPVWIGSGWRRWAHLQSVAHRVWPAALWCAGRRLVFLAAVGGCDDLNGWVCGAVGCDACAVNGDESFEKHLVNGAFFNFSVIDEHFDLQRLV